MNTLIERILSVRAGFLTLYTRVNAVKFSAKQAAIVLAIAVLGSSLFTFLSWLAEKNHEFHLIQRLPPGITDLADRPEPKLLQRGLGADWLIASSPKGEWRTVIYYPNTIRLDSVRLVPTQNFPGTQVQFNDFKSYEVQASLVRNGVMITEVIQFPPLLDPKPLFIGIDPKAIEEMTKDFERNQKRRGK